MGQDLPNLKENYARLKPWIAVAALVALALLGYYLWLGARYWQASTAAASAREEIQALERKMRAVPDSVSRFSNELKAKQARVNAVQGLFAVSATDELLGIISATATESAVELKSIRSEGSREEILGNLEYDVAPVGITLEGPVDNFSRFLSLLQQKVPVVSATQLRISGLDANPTAKMQLFFYLSPHAIEKTEEKSSD